MLLAKALMSRSASCKCISEPEPLDLFKRLVSKCLHWHLGFRLLMIECGKSKLGISKYIVEIIDESIVYSFRCTECYFCLSGCGGADYAREKGLPIMVFPKTKLEPDGISPADLVANLRSASSTAQKFLSLTWLFRMSNHLLICYLFDDTPQRGG